MTTGQSTDLTPKLCQLVVALRDQSSGCTQLRRQLNDLVRQPLLGVACEKEIPSKQCSAIYLSIYPSLPQFDNPLPDRLRFLSPLTRRLLETASSLFLDACRIVQAVQHLARSRGERVAKPALPLEHLAEPGFEHRDLVGQEGKLGVHVALA